MPLRPAGRRGARRRPRATRTAGHGRWGEALHADLDEQERPAPDEAEEQEPAHRESLAVRNRSAVRAGPECRITRLHDPRALRSQLRSRPCPESLVERRLTEVSDRLRQLREELRVADEQLAHFADEADDARLRALVSETPLAEQEHREAQKHADAMGRHRADVLAELEALERTQDELLDRLVAGSIPDRADLKPPHSNRQGEPALPTRVVIAEDEAIIRLDLKETLEEEGYEVVAETGRGDEAVQLVRELEPDIAILDIKMPGLDGLVRRPRDRRRAPGRGADPHRVQPARPDRAGPRRRGARLPGQAVPDGRAGAGRRGRARPLPGDEGPRTTRPPASSEQLETRKVVDRAKGKLMDEHGLTEGDAFRFIQKTAMRRAPHDDATSAQRDPRRRPRRPERAESRAGPGTVHGR